jgi:hypothetical protein
MSNCGRFDDSKYSNGFHCSYLKELSTSIVPHEIFAQKLNKRILWLDEGANKYIIEEDNWILTFPKLSNLDSDAIGVAISFTSKSNPMINGCELLQSSSMHNNVSLGESIKFPGTNSPGTLDSKFKVLLEPEQSNPFVRRAHLFILEFTNCFLLD